MIRLLPVLLCGLLILTACSADEETPLPAPSPSPVGLLTIRMNSFGRVEFEASPGFVTPSAVDAPGNARNYLTLRINDNDFYYDLGGQSFEIRFESEDFTAVNGRKSGDNYFLQAVPINTPFIVELSTRTPAAECPDAPPTQFVVGDTVQVDFNSVGALKIRLDPFTDKSIMQVYDNARLTLLEGPLCGGDRWVWKVYYAPSDITGWASEGITDDPWMCPLSSPECGN